MNITPPIPPRKGRDRIDTVNVLVSEAETRHYQQCIILLKKAAQAVDKGGIELLTGSIVFLE